MKMFRGMWYPDHEEHLMKWIADNNHYVEGRGAYQWAKQTLAYQLLGKCGSQYRTAVDVGAHVGLWATHMAKRFKKVLAFEPVEEHRQCFRKNVPEPNVTLFSVALGASMGSDRRVALVTEIGSSGNTHINEAMGGDVPLHTLDNYQISDLDFLKIDCEGYEYFVLQGAEQTIRQNRPVIVVEQKPNHGSRYGLNDIEAVHLLARWGAKVAGSVGGDYFMTF